MKWKEIAIAVGVSFALAETVWAVQPPFPEAWTSAYESIPADTEQESLGASRIRDLKTQIRIRMQQEHSWNGDGNDGFNNFVGLLQQSIDPSPQYDLNLTGGEVYTKLVGSADELFYKDSTGKITQLTSGGQLNTGVSVPSGTVSFTAATTIPTGWDACDGSAHSRTGEANLFAAIGTTYGAGDGQTTFNVPDDRGRFVAGLDLNNQTGRLTAAQTGGTNASVLGNVGGVQQLTLVAANIPPLTSTGTTSGTTASLPATFNLANNEGQGAASGGQLAADRPGPTSMTIPSESVSVTSTGTSSAPFNNVPPSLVLQCMIKQ